MPTDELNNKLNGLYVITDTNLMTAENTLDKVEQALLGGAKIVQFRDKVSTDEIKHQLAKQLSNLCRKYNACFIVNDDIELAKLSNADGVHIGKDDAGIHKARQILGDQAIIGVSCYNDLQRALTMQNAGASYVAFGRFFASQTKPTAPPADLNTLTLAKQQLSIPVVAIGGIDSSNAESVIDAGADSIAVIQGVFAKDDIQQAAQQLQQLFNN